MAKITFTELEDIGRIEIKNVPGDKQHIRVAICRKDTGRILDIREHVESTSGTPFTGFTKRGLRLEGHVIVEMLAYMRLVQQRLEITDEMVDEAYSEITKTES